jgi:hypothetical protein
VLTNAALWAFGACTSGGPQTINFVSLGTASSGAGSLILVSAQLATPIVVNNGINPQIAIGGATFNLD